MNKESVFKSGKIALVTGAASGIGRADCEIFVERGMSVCMVDSNSDTLARTTRDLSEGLPERQMKLLTVTADVADIHQMNKVKSELMDHKRILWAAEDITENRAALSRWHPSYMEQAKSRGI